MSDRPFDTPSEERILSRVREGMNVYDSSGERIGSVEYVHFGSGSDTSGTPTGNTGNNLISAIADAFVAEDRVPETVQARLQTGGFIRLNTANIFKGDRYIAADNVVAIDRDGVHLNVHRDKLIKG